ncbi:outer membrane lipoprotein carrier protein LolA [Lysinibacillus sp. KU-BSD001]|uniref:LolA family protein n=1 Tax=Lysinibacillus sp. KU-BSD001 TaxID=3141328 RepID=UPI0036EC2881
MRFRLISVLVIMSFLLVACGGSSQEKVVGKLGEEWGDGKGYELTATMEMKTGGEPRTYDVNVWHTKPDFYRVTVTEQNDNVTQMIVRNEEGVFVVTPALRKTYKFQSEWPKQNSQAYLIGALAQDIAEDKEAVMTEKDGEYIFETATRNAEKTGLPLQKIIVDKKTMLPKSVVIMDESKEEKIMIDFKEIDLSVAHKKEEYAVEKFSENEENEVAAADIEDKELQTHYPSVQWENTKLADETVIQEDGVERVVLTFEGEKAYTLMQQPAASGNSVLPVFAPGDLADLGFTIGAITDTSISWEKDGVSFFLASTKLTREEMMEVAASMTVGNVK